MIGTKVVDTTDNKHASLQGFGLAGQVAAATGQPSQTLAKSGIEPFDKGGVNLTSPLTGLQQLNHLLGAALNHPPDNGQMAIKALFDHLDDGDLRPEPQLTATRLTPARDRAAKSPMKGVDIASQTIHRQQQRSAQGHTPNLVGQALDQGLIPLPANHSTQPQPGGNHYRHGHPNDPTQNFDFDFIGLYLKQIKQTASPHMLMHPLTMLPSPPPPVLDRPLIEPKGDHNGLDGTPLSQQGQHQDHPLRLRFQPIENTTFAGTKGLFADRTLTSLFFETMDADITTSTLSSCRTVNVRAKYLFEVHWALLLVVVT